MVPRSSVLIVDRSDESREVLKTALERRGWQIFETARAADGVALARRHRPDLIVLDMDAAGAKAAHGALTADAEVQEIPLVLLGSIRRSSRLAITDQATASRTLATRTTSARATGRLGQIVTKPYHYGSLILKIEQMLRQG